MNLISKKSSTHSRHYSSYYYYLTNFYPFVPLLKYFLRDKMLFRRSHGQNILPFWGTSCKNMWWPNTLWCIQRPLTTYTAMPPPCLEPVIANLGCMLWLFILSSLFLWKPSHDNAVGTTDKADQKFHRRTASCQDDGWLAQQISVGLVKQKHVATLLFAPWIMYRPT